MTDIVVHLTRFL